jgi:hypothetical protein
MLGTYSKAEDDAFSAAFGGWGKKIEQGVRCNWLHIP